VRLPNSYLRMYLVRSQPLRARAWNDKFRAKGRLLGGGFSDRDCVSTSAKLYRTPARSTSASKQDGQILRQRFSTTVFQAACRAQELEPRRHAAC
jgi:hypothetical protein